MNAKIKKLIKDNKFLYLPIKKKNEYQEKKRIKKFQQIGYQLNQEIYDALDGAGFEYYIGAGGLLGLVREGGFLKYDDDLDYFIKMPDANGWAKLTRLLEDAGFHMMHFFFGDNKILEIAFQKEGIQVDFIGLFLKNDDVMYYYSLYREKGVAYSSEEVSTAMTYLENLENFEEKEVNGSIFMIPKEWEKVLIAAYGESWRTPIKNFSWKDLKELHPEIITHKYILK